MKYFIVSEICHNKQWLYKHLVSWNNKEEFLWSESTESWLNLSNKKHGPKSPRDYVEKYTQHSKMYFFASKKEAKEVAFTISRYELIYRSVKEKAFNYKTNYLIFSLVRTAATSNNSHFISNVTIN